MPSPTSAFRPPPAAAAALIGSTVTAIVLLAFGLGTPAIGGSTQPARPAVWAGGLLAAVSLLLLHGALRHGWHRRLGPLSAVQLVASLAALALPPLSKASSHLAAGTLFVGVLAAEAGVLVLAAYLNSPREEGGDGPPGLGAHVFLASLLVFGASAAWVSALVWPDADEPHYLLLSESLASDGDFDLSNDYAQRRYEAFYRPSLEERHTIRTVGDEELPVHDAGLSLLVLPGYVAGGRLGAVLVVTLTGAVACLGLVRVSRLLGASARGAVLAWGLFAFCSPFATYTSQVYPEIPGAALALWAIVALDAFRRGAGLASLVAAGTLLGALPWLSVRHWTITAAVSAVAVAAILRSPSRSGRGRALAALGAGLFVPLAALSAFDFWLFHDPRPNAGYFLLTESTSHPAADAPRLSRLVVGLPGLLFDQAFGLLPTAPVYVVAFAGAVLAWRSARAVAAPLLAAVAATVALIAPNAFWYGGWAPPSRYVVVAAALLAPFASRVLPVHSRPARWIVTVAAAWGLAISAVFTLQPTIRYTFWDGRLASLWTWLGEGGAGALGRLFPSLLRSAPLDWALVALWTVLATVGAAALVRSVSRP